MRPATPTQAEFAAALWQPARSVPAGLHARNGSDPVVRLDVHRNNVIVSLSRALADTFPVVQRLVGDECFAAMAGVFVREQPPHSPVLSDYGDGFADWLAAFEPMAHLPYLPDMARLERARVRAWHADDVVPLDASSLMACLQRPERLHALQLRVHPATTPVVCDWAVVSLWAAHQHDDDAPISQVALDRAEAALVLRTGDEVRVHPVAPADATFVQALQRSQPLADAVQAALTAAKRCGDAPFDLTATLSLLIRHASLIAWHLPGDLE